jgi:hypothetical protein
MSSSTHSLEAERDMILSRIHASREQYRRMLMDEQDVQTQNSQPYEDFQHDASSGVGHHFGQPGGGYYQHDDQGSSGAHPADLAIAALNWAKQHPLLCAAVVTAIVAIGPRRIMRSALASGTALTALTLRNPQNIDTASRLISTVAGYMQKARSTRYPP